MPFSIESRGIIVLDGHWKGYLEEAQHLLQGRAAILNGGYYNLRSKRDPFVVMTALFRRAAIISQDRPVIIHSFSELYEALGLFRRMAQRVMLKYAMVRCLNQDPRGPLLHVAESFLVVNHYRSIQYPPALLHSNRNLCGHAGLAKFLFVGDSINPVYRNFNHWPFHANSGCTVFMAHCLEEINFDECHGMWTNIDCDEQHIVKLLEFKPDMGIIALGKKAEEGLQHLGVHHVPLFHPQYAKRFLSKTLNYAETIKSAICSLTNGAEQSHFHQHE